MKPTLQGLGLIAGAFFLVFSMTACPGPERENTPADAKANKAKTSAPALDEETSEEEDDITIEDPTDPVLELEEESLEEDETLPDEEELDTEEEMEPDSVEEETFEEETSETEAEESSEEPDDEF
jgi:hypothetical protein